MRLAGGGDLADRLLSPHSIETRTAYYGDLFRSPDQMMDEYDFRDLTPDQLALADELALEWLDRVAERPVGSANAEQSRLAFDIVREPKRPQTMGHGNALARGHKDARPRFLARPAGDVGGQEIRSHVLRAGLPLSDR